MTGVTMETWVFDRSGPYSGATFNVHEEPEKFVQVLCGYLMMSDEELGLDILTEEKDGRRFVMIPMIHQSMCNGTDTTRAQSEARAIVSRATACFAAKPIGAPEFDRVIKYSWIPSTWTPDADLLSKVNEQSTMLKVLQQRKWWTMTGKLRAQASSVTHQDLIPYDDRVLRVLTVTPLGRALQKFESILELLECIRDAIKVHRSLYMERGILHGNISVRNIIITEPAKADGYKGMLIDLQSAHDMTKGPSGTRHQTGISEAKGEGRKPIDALPDWSGSNGSYNSIASMKLRNMGAGFGLLMQNRYPVGWGQLVEECITFTTIRDILFTVPHGVEVEPYRYTPGEPDAMYGPILEAFEIPIRDMKGQGWDP
ncbi:hypothetical protein E4U17_002327 [Claviceps sp. LM77 group G4]|nr:hypothetical protein E4U17_002327 [Claviceps sp. LM77 group G4]